MIELPTAAVHPIVLSDLTHILEAPLDWERFRAKTILITGGNGFLPAYMIEALLLLNTLRGLDCHVICLVRSLAKAKARFSEYDGRPDLSFSVSDVSKGIPVERHCDFVIHAASQASPKYFGTDPVGTMGANLLGTHHLLTLSHRWNSEGFMLFSSAEVYGQVSPESIPTREADYGYIDILNPRSCYAESKRAAETLTVSFAQQFGVHSVIVRPFHTYGPGMALDDGRVYADFVRDVSLRRDIALRSDGRAIRAFCYLADAVRAFFTVLLKGVSGQAYNVGNPAGAMSVAELAHLLVDLEPDLNLKVIRSGDQTPGYLTSPVATSSPNIDRLQELGWHPIFAPREGFNRTIRYFAELASTTAPSTQNTVQ